MLQGDNSYYIISRAQLVSDCKQHSVIHKDLISSNFIHHVMIESNREKSHHIMYNSRDNVTTKENLQKVIKKRIRRLSHSMKFQIYIEKINNKQEKI